MHYQEKIRLQDNKDANIYSQRIGRLFEVKKDQKQNYQSSLFVGYTEISVKILRIFEKQQKLVTTIVLKKHPEKDWYRSEFLNNSSLFKVESSQFYGILNIKSNKWVVKLEKGNHLELRL